MMQDHERHFGTIEATGEGKVTTRPDVANIRLGISTDAKTAREATAQNAVVAGRIIDAIRKVGIDADAIQTVGLSLGPIYEWDDVNKRSVLVGYRTGNVVAVRAPVGKAGEVYDAGFEAGANEGGGVTFGLSDDRAARREAMAEAADLAHRECQLVARTLGVTLRGPVEVQILDGGGPRSVEFTGLRKAEGTPVMAGEIQVSERVRVVYQTKAG